MALTASKSPGTAGRISTVVPSASSAYTAVGGCAMLTILSRRLCRWLGWLREWLHAEQQGGTRQRGVHRQHRLQRVDLVHRVERVDLVHRVEWVDLVHRVGGLGAIDRLGRLVRVRALDLLGRQRRLGAVRAVAV